MSTPSPVPNPLQALLTFIETDALSTFATPLLTFLQADAAAGGDILKIEAALIALQGDIVAAVPKALPGLVAELGVVNSQLALLLAAKLQARISASKPA